METKQFNSSTRKLFINILQFLGKLTKSKTKIQFNQSMVGIRKNYFKMFAIKFSTIKNQNINKQHKNLTKNILQEKIKTNPDKNKIEKWQRSIENLENYKTKGTVIRSKGRFIVIEEKPTKYFYQ